MGIDDQIRSIESRLTALEVDRTNLLSELKTLRAKRDEYKPVGSRSIKNFLKERFFPLVGLLGMI